MLNITDGRGILTVTKGAFREIYSPAGWVVVNESPSETPEEPSMAPMGMGGPNPTIDPDNHSEDSQEAQSGDDTLDKMSAMELKQYASLLGVSTKHLNTRKELLKAIKDHKE